MTDKVNEIIKIIKKSPLNDHPKLDWFLINTQIRHIRERVEVIQDAIALAKKQIVNHKLITSEEIHLLAETLIKTGIHLDFPEQVLNFVTPVVGVEGNTLIYILTLPKFKLDTYTAYQIEPIVTNEEIIEIPTKFYATKFPKIFAIKGSPKQFLKFYLCNRDEIQAVEKDDCVWRLLFGGTATCKFKKIPDNYEKMTEISISTVLVNDQQTTIKKRIPRKKRNRTLHHRIQQRNNQHK